MASTTCGRCSRRVGSGGISNNRPSRPGIVQLNRPSRDTSAGVSNVRTISASMAMPRASAVARIFTSTDGTVDNATKDRNKISAAEVTNRPVLAIPATTARSVDPCAS